MATVSERAPLEWSDDLATGHAAVDAEHRAFVQRANALATASDASLLAELRAFEQHARQHFAAEDALMRDSRCPSAGCHRDEHQAVLKSVAEVIARVADGQLHIGRALSDELLRWFPEHTEHMDKGLTQWLLKQATGAQPVVFRRRA